MAFKDDVQQLQDMIFSGQLLEAFDKYYHEEVSLQENFEAPRVGKPANRAYEEQFLANIETFHGGAVTNLAVDEEKQVAFVESWMEVTFKGAEKVKMGQVSVQQWKDGQVFHERFYHP